MTVQLSRRALGGFAALIPVLGAPAAARASDERLEALERHLEAERAYRASLPDHPGQAVLEASYDRSDALEDAILSTPATSSRGLAVKLRQLHRDLDIQGIGSRWLTSARSDLERGTI